MNTEPEPLAAILAEFRAFALRAAEEDKMISPENVLLLADKVEAAAKGMRAMLDGNIARVRELDALLDGAANTVLGCAIKQKRSAPGDAAALREALLKVLECYKSGAIRTEYNDPDSWKHDDELCSLKDDVEAALAAPARNCDRFADPGKAWLAYKAECDKNETVPNMIGAILWLLAPVKGGAE